MGQLRERNFDFLLLIVWGGGGRVECFFWLLTFAYSAGRAVGALLFLIVDCEMGGQYVFVL